jgi:hypothetical protein
VEDEVRVFSERQWLNELGFHGHAFIVAVVCKADDYGTDSELTIGDCSRTISLQFDGHSRAQMDNSVRKLDRLIDVLTRFRAALVPEMESGLAQIEARRAAQPDETRKTAAIKTLDES